MHKLTIMDGSGHSTLEYDPTVEAERTRIAAEFDRLVAEGHLLYKVEERENTHIREFDPTAKEIIATPNWVGG